MLIYLERAVFGPDVTIRPRPLWLAFRKAFSHAPLHVFRNAVAFLLCNGSQNGKQHFGGGTGGIQIVFIKKNVYAKFLESSDILQAVHRVTGKAGNTFCNDIVYFPGFAVSNHPLELHTFFSGRTTQALVCIDTGQFPTRMRSNQGFERLDLRIQAGLLDFLIRTDTAIGRHPHDRDLVLALRCVPAKYLNAGRNDILFYILQHAYRLSTRPARLFRAATISPARWNVSLSTMAA